VQLLNQVSTSCQLAGHTEALRQALKKIRVGGNTKMVMGTRQRSSDRRERFFVFALAGIAVLTLASTIGFADSGKASMSGRAKAGSEVFQKNCVSCHNKQAGDTSPFGPPNLHGVFKTGLTPEEAQKIIANGKGGMPAWSNVLTSSDIQNVIAYLKTQ
jgi:mono/diheme cytochrome c family protein